MEHHEVMIEILTDCIDLYESGNVEWCKFGNVVIDGFSYDPMRKRLAEDDLLRVEAACIQGVVALAYRLNPRGLVYEQSHHYVDDIRDEMRNQVRSDHGFKNSVFLVGWNDGRPFESHSAEGTEFMTGFLKRVRSRIQEKSHAVSPIT